MSGGCSGGDYVFDTSVSGVIQLFRMHLSSGSVKGLHPQVADPEQKSSEM